MVQNSGNLAIGNNNEQNQYGAAPVQVKEGKKEIENKDKQAPKTDEKVVKETPKNDGKSKTDRLKSDNPGMKKLKQGEPKKDSTIEGFFYSYGTNNGKGHINIVQEDYNELGEGAAIKVLSLTLSKMDRSDLADKVAKMTDINEAIAYIKKQGVDVNVLKRGRTCESEIRHEITKGQEKPVCVNLMPAVDSKLTAKERIIEQLQNTVFAYLKNDIQNMTDINQIIKLLETNGVQVAR